MPGVLQLRQDTLPRQMASCEHAQTAARRSAAEALLEKAPEERVEEESGRFLNNRDLIFLFDLEKSLLYVCKVILGLFGQCDDNFLAPLYG